jgi:hypothetical protein
VGLEVDWNAGTASGGDVLLKRTLVLTVLAALLAVAASAQVEAPPPASGGPKYEVYVGAAYTRLKQVPNSYSGLVGGKATLGRDLGKYFQLFGSVDYYSLGTGHSDYQNKGNPTVYTFMVGPQVHATLYGNLSGLVFGELGGEHTGNENMTPSISFAGGFGGGLKYRLSHRWAVQLTADRVGASFSLPNNTAELGYSTHRTWNARYTGGVVYHF